MSDIMRPIPFSDLMNWILKEHEAYGSVLGMHTCYQAPPGKTLSLFGERMETPFGPAAGPHTQLAQNIIAAYYAGARFFELKTVQIMDGEELSKCVPKPCIVAEDEGYNCEWSTELTVEQALDEYVKAWYACKLLAREYALGDENGFVFNMSVGYDFAGITSPKIDGFIEGLRDASRLPVFQECAKWTMDNLGQFQHVDAAYTAGVSPRVSNSITLSTLHGCPPQEIERIAAYLLETKHMHTFVKCNPTILGYESARRILDSMGYDYIAFDDHHFREDLQFADAKGMFARLQKLAAAQGLEFGLKLSNTFPVDVKRGELPSEEMYMSGRALYPLTIEMANRFCAEFDGSLRISFSGGADAYNIRALFEAGIWPVTMATTLLKAGGYERFVQIAELFEAEPYAAFTGVSVSRVETLAHMALHTPHHTKPIKPVPSKKLEELLPRSNCFTAPCTHGCPIGQDIPEYVFLVGQGRHLEALRLITEKNPLPFITGRICTHRCMDKCVRGFYEEPIRIRNTKLEAARGGVAALLAEMRTPNVATDKRAAIIGGGPAGMAAAYFLGRAGMQVTLFEKRETLGGIVRHVIPEFRISNAEIEQDVELMEKMGVRCELGKEAPDVATLRQQGFSYVLIATGAWKPGRLRLEQGEAINVLAFLEACKNGSVGEVGKDICIVGGGNSAMDAARAARRLPGVENVRIIYRRTRKYMPADEEELALCAKEGILFNELLAPLSLKDGELTCTVMQLGDPDASGRRAPVETRQTIRIACSTLIAAVGESVDTDMLRQNGIAVDERGHALYDANTMAVGAGMYLLGDARRGPATVVEAIADAQSAANDILAQAYMVEPQEDAYCTPQDCRKKHGKLSVYNNASREAERCLFCSVTCELCVQVCPNRANVSICVDGEDTAQILHIERMCNECGNCAVFCPYEGGPYLRKPTLFHNETDFNASENEGFLFLDDQHVRARFDGKQIDVDLKAPETGLPIEMERLLFAVRKAYAYLL